MHNNVERIAVRIYEGSRQAGLAVAARIADLIRQRSGEGKSAVLGLATGHTPVQVYQELIRLHREGGLDLSNVVSFNLDEYWPCQSQSLHSYHRWMREHFFQHVNIRPGNIHIPPGDVSEERIDAACREYEQAIRDAGGIDLQILGIGRSGHVGFNEPGSSPASRTRRVRLDKVTRRDAASDFLGEENVPEQAITMGVGTILEAREIALLAFGEHKAPIVRRAVEGEVASGVAASFLQQHGRATFYLDEAAGAELTRLATPWLLGDCQWDAPLRRRAVIWLARKLDKCILKLTEEDYVENHLYDLRDQAGGAYHLNLDAFRHLMRTITGWPAGKGAPRRIVIFSPHPDDDVICMGGTMARLAQQGHDVHVAYMVSGYLSVFDHDAGRHADFVRDFNRIFGLTPGDTDTIEQHIDRFLRQKSPGDIDTPEIRRVKGLIRRTEAVDAAKFCGLAEGHIHFLDLPFYNSGTVQKLSTGPEDVRIVREILQSIGPDMVFMAGDLSDPHGTHRLCQEVALTALRELAGGTGFQPVLSDQSTGWKPVPPMPEVWYYRGAWQEWPPEQIDMAVPLSPDELRHKRYAIFRHQSQKDRAMFPGPYDSREFWQRAEERNIGTARIYDKLGLPEYHALEAFVRHPVERSAHAAGQLQK